MKLLNHPYNTTACAGRLYQDYRKHNNLIVAFDFDNTIFDYHNNGGNYSEVINLLKECSDLGFTMILFTANDSKTKLDWMWEYCNIYGIRVDYINESPVMNTVKPYYNILLDDRAGLESAYETLSLAVNAIKNLIIEDANTKSNPKG